MTKAAKALKSKTENIAAATDIEKADCNKLEQLIDKYGPVKVAAAGAAGRWPHRRSPLGTSVANTRTRSNCD